MSDKKDKEIQFYRKLICEIYEIVIKKNLFEQDENFKIKNVDFISAGVKWADLLTRRKKEVMVWVIQERHQIRFYETKKLF